MPKIYHDKIQSLGSGSNQTLYLDEIPTGMQLYVRHMAACIYTTNPGDYTTSKFIWLGYEHHGVKFYIAGHDINASNSILPGVVFVKNFYIPENARPFAYVELTSASQKVELMVNGALEEISK